MNKTIAAVISLLLVVSFFCGPALASSRHWKIGHVRPAGLAIDKDIQVLVDQIKTKTNGSILIDIYPANKLGDYSVVQERVSFGEVEMYVGPFGTAVDKRVALAFAPFIVSTWEDAKNVYRQGSVLFNEMSDILESQNIKLIGGWPVYFGGIALTKKPIQPQNPDVSKDTIIRVPPIRTFERTARAMGYTPYPITWTYAKMGLKTGMVEGIIGGGAEGYLGLKDVVKYYLPVKDHFEYWFVYMNLDVWKRLSEETKAIMIGLCGEMEKKRYAVAESDERESLEKLKDAGIEIIAFDEQEQSRIEEKVKKIVWPEMRKEIGDAFDTVVP